MPPVKNMFFFLNIDNCCAESKDVDTKFPLFLV